MNDFQQYLVDEFAEDYQEGRISRREALRLIASVTGSIVVATTILAACAPMETAETSELIPTTGAGEGQPTNPPRATSTQPAAPTQESTPTQTGGATQAPTAGTSEPPVSSVTVSPDDPAVQAGAVEFPASDGATLLGYHAYPQGDGPFPVVLVCHENRGLTPHIQDVTRRLAKAGYAALAVDLLSRQGGVSKFSTDEVPGALGNTPPEQFIRDFLNGWEFLKAQTYTQPERVGMVGFCFGGGVTWRMATNMPELRAAVPFYGPHPAVEDVPKIQAAVLAIYGGNDTRINSGIPAIEEAMTANQKIYEKVIYEGADHAFHNDTSTRYNAKAARDAWSRTLAWFGKYV